MAANNTVTVYGSIQDRYNIQAPKSARQEVFGLHYPLGSSKNGGVFNKTSGINMIKGAVEQLLLTERGERVMLPNFGCNLRRYLFQPLDETTFNSIKREIQTSFSNYIVGAKITKLSVFPTGDSGPAGGNSLKVILSLKLDKSDLEIFDVEVKIA
jgi:phage baseplate assembly protein W|tara:strand:+ start:1545 stop:2009 length:465 start_codon:yes stop_codon:yes gene_type:complete